MRGECARVQVSLHKPIFLHPTFTQPKVKDFPFHLRYFSFQNFRCGGIIWKAIRVAGENVTNRHLFGYVEAPYMYVDRRWRYAVEEYGTESVIFLTIAQ